MPWFDPLPSPAQTAYWRTPEVGGFHKVSRWPQIDTPRIDSRYRINGTRDTDPSPLRWICYWKGQIGDPDVEEMGWFDIAPVVADHLYGDSGASPTGHTFSLRIEARDPLPIVGERGVLLTMRIDHTSGEWFERVNEYEYDTALAYRVPHYTTFHNPSSSSASQSAGWPWSQTTLSVQGVSECYDFPSIAAPPIGFAAFNGTTSFIQLDHIVPLRGEDYDYEFDIRMQGNDAMVLGKLNDGRPYVRILGTTYYNGDFHSYALNPAPQIGVWSSIKQEWRWPEGPTAMKIYVDGQLAGQGFGSSQQFGGFDLIGRYNAGTFDIWAHCDLRNVKLTTYPVSGPRIELDMPLQSNTCDLSADQNHGTPTDVGLPSCPP